MKLVMMIVIDRIGQGSLSAKKCIAEHNHDRIALKVPQVADDGNGAEMTFKFTTDEKSPLIISAIEYHCCYLRFRYLLTHPSNDELLRSMFTMFKLKLELRKLIANILRGTKKRMWIKTSCGHFRSILSKERPDFASVVLLAPNISISLFEIHPKGDSRTIVEAPPLHGRKKRA